MVCLSKKVGIQISVGIVLVGLCLYGIQATYSYIQKLSNTLSSSQQKSASLSASLAAVQKELRDVKNEDQYVKNKELQNTIKLIEDTYVESVKEYENLLALKTLTKKTDEVDKKFAQILAYLADRNYASGSAELIKLRTLIQDERQKAIASFQIPANIAESNSPPGSGYSRQLVRTEIGEYMVDIIAADLNSTRVIVDTATDGDCKNDCPVLPLAEYVSRNGGFAGINGSYFCPADYPSCADKKNSFDTLAMNKNKKYINSDNNVYSTVPAVIFQNGSTRFVGRSLDWGRSTDVDGVLANQPLLMSDGNIAFTGDGEPKRGSKGSRSFVGGTGSMVYIGVVHNATVAEVAYVMKTLGIQNALNLDSGGSTALWNGGYKAGPGRNLPNAIVFQRK